ncbi:MAG TPA: recombination mediator RecR [Gammaproteobacteria bacterium]|nr:recombination mediator RecR [Gammaproteobacteria bacterium]
MLRKLPSLERLIRQLQYVPYLASKNIYRVALHFLESDEHKLEQFCAVLLQAKKNLMTCQVCYNWHEKEDACALCSDERRDKTKICVVETWHDLMAIERAGGYEGLFHVLGGSLCPLEGIGPDNLTIDALVQRVHAMKECELIFATNPTPEGEATASFIASKLEGGAVTISKVASGLPIGSSLAYMDRVTIFKALSGRRPF